MVIIEIMRNTILRPPTSYILVKMARIKFIGRLGLSVHRKADEFCL